jgi:uncharacterized membrane protein
MILLFFISLLIAWKWKGSLTKCGFIGMTIYVLINGMASSTNLQFQYGQAGGFIYGAIMATVFSIFLIWIPVWIIMFVRRKRSRKTDDQSPRSLQKAVVAAAQSEAAPPVLIAAQPIEQLERLAALRERGAITPEEFEAQKRKLLD